MHNPYDHLGKTIGCSALRACGPTEMEAVIAPDPRRADLRHEAGTDLEPRSPVSSTMIYAPSATCSPSCTGG